MQPLTCQLDDRQLSSAESIEVVKMTEPVVCHAGRCKDRRAFLDECLDCDLVEQIEHDLFAEDIKSVLGG